MPVEQITAYEFTYIPWDRDFPIRRCVMTVYARDRKEAELTALSYNWKFFGESCTVTVQEFGGGYREIK